VVFPFMSSSTVNSSRSPRNRELDCKTPTPSPRTRAQIDSARVSCPAPPSDRPAISPAVMFIARAEARALLWQAGEFELHEAVDGLQAAADRQGLLAELGQDAVQAIIAKAFEAVR
jgi:hypothetical protein